MDKGFSHFSFDFSETFEFEEGDIVPLPDSLFKHADAWDSFENSEFSKSVATFGYKVPFQSVPQPFFAKNNKSSLDNYEFATKAIEALIDGKIIEEVFEPPFCTNPLTVAERNGKLRLCIDLSRSVNKWTKSSAFKIESIESLKDVIEKDSLHFSFDLKSCYHHFKLHPSVCTYFGFA